LAGFAPATDEHTQRFALDQTVPNEIVLKSQGHRRMAGDAWSAVTVGGIAEGLNRAIKQMGGTA
jgi:hypothetical protein